MGVKELWLKLIFENMTEETWKAIIVPGVAGSLLYDLNGTLYNVANDVYGIGPSLDGKQLVDRKAEIIAIRSKFKENPEELHGKFFSKLKECLDRNLDEVNPTYLLILALDGIAPRTKLDQQATRRFVAAEDRATKAKSRHESGGLNDYDSEPYMFNTLNFTPGTPFMKRCCDCVREWIQEKRDIGKLPTFVYFSDCSERGEAEHKIFKLFEILISQLDEAFKSEAKVLPSNIFKRSVHTVMGLDSDLCFITMLRMNYNFYWIRDVDHSYKQRRTIATKHQKYNEEEKEYDSRLSSTNITNVRKFILEHMGCTSEDPVVQFHYIMDMVLLSFHIGDDFVPANFAITLDARITLNKMMECYSQLDDIRLTEEGIINIGHLALFYRLMAAEERLLYEEKALTQHVEKEYEEKKKQRINAPKLEAKRDELRTKFKRKLTEKFEPSFILEYDFDAFIEIWPKIIVCPSMITPTRTSTRFDLYQEIASENAEQDLELICENYLTGLQWNLSYYLGEKVNNWMYEWHLPPTITHLFNFLCSRLSEDESEILFTIPSVVRKASDNDIDPTKVIFSAMNIVLSNRVVNECLATGKKTSTTERTLNKVVAPGKIFEKIPYYTAFYPISFERFTGGYYYNPKRSRHGDIAFVPKIPTSILFRIGVNDKLPLNFSKKICDVKDDTEFDMDDSGNCRIISEMRGGISFNASDEVTFVGEKKKKTKPKTEHSGESESKGGETESKGGERKPKKQSKNGRTSDKHERREADRSVKRSGGGEPMQRRRCRPVGDGYNI